MSIENYLSFLIKKKPWFIWCNHNDFPYSTSYATRQDAENVALEYANDNHGMSYSILCLHSVVQCCKAEVIPWDAPEVKPPSEADYILACIGAVERLIADIPDNKDNKDAHWLERQSLNAHLNDLKQQLAELEQLKPPSEADHLRARIADVQAEIDSCEHWEGLKESSLKMVKASLLSKLADLENTPCEPPKNA